MSGMGQYSIGEAIKIYLERSGMKEKVAQIRLANEWSAIAGHTIARYTNNVRIANQVLYISTDVPALKHELLYSKQQLIERINVYLEGQYVKDIVIR